MLLAELGKHRPVCMENRGVYGHAHLCVCMHACMRVNERRSVCTSDIFAFQDYGDRVWS